MDLTIETDMRQALIARRAGRIEEARTIYLSVLRRNPDHPDANHNLGMIEVAAKRIESSISFFETAVKSDPAREVFWESYIESLIGSGHHRDAKKALVRCNLGKEKKRIYNNKRLAAIFENKEQPSATQISALIDFYEKGKKRAAKELANNLLRQYPSHSLSWRILGATHSELGEWEEALIAAKHLAEAEPNEASTLHNLSMALRKTGKFFEAETKARKAILNDPSFADAYENLGNSQLLGRLAEREKFKEVHRSKTRSYERPSQSGRCII